MTYQQALLAQIIATPDDDTPRLVCADWLDENDQPERAEFIRVQVELARIDAELEGTRAAYWTTDQMKAHGRRNTLRSRERELLRDVTPSDTFNVCEWMLGWPVSGRMWLADGSVDYRPPGGTTESFGGRFRRGFVHAVTCTAADWDEHAPALVWPATVECPVCEGKKGWVNPVGGFREFSGPYPVWKPCPSCSGTGRVPNPDPPAATCQPVREVTLTTWPDVMKMYELCRATRFGESSGNRIERWKEILEAKWQGITFHLPAVADPDASVGAPGDHLSYP